jgi:hypothetical protein
MWRKQLGRDAGCTALYLSISMLAPQVDTGLQQLGFGEGQEAEQLPDHEANGLLCGKDRRLARRRCA